MKGGQNMINYIWAFLILVSIVVCAFTGRIDQVANAAIKSSNEAITMVLTLCGAMCLWSGLMKIAEEGNLVKVLSKLLYPVTKRLFREIPQKSQAMGYIVMNIVANILGMGNAATPLGIKAMEELDKLNGKSARASCAMCTFVVLNTASIQLIPANMIALRMQAGSSNPSEIIVPVWIISFITLISVLLCAKIHEKMDS